MKRHDRVLFARFQVGQRVHMSRSVNRDVKDKYGTVVKCIKSRCVIRVNVDGFGNYDADATLLDPAGDVEATECAGCGNWSIDCVCDDSIEMEAPRGKTRST